MKKLKMNTFFIMSQNKVKFIFGWYSVLFNYNTSKTMCSARDYYEIELFNVSSFLFHSI